MVVAWELGKIQMLLWKEQGDPLASLPPPKKEQRGPWRDSFVPREKPGRTPSAPQP